MLGWVCGVSEVWGVIRANIVVGASLYYLLLCGTVLCVFISYRVPYVFSPFCFILILWFLLMGGFLSLVGCRLWLSFSVFVGGFIPVGTPLWVCPLVCVAETVSYIIRPLVLMLRPFINIGLGCSASALVGGLCSVSWIWVTPLAVLFFYEVFVALVHWFIVTSILDFSIEH
uniref:ATP synthase F0 subunit 6 n=1 Tax=Breviscolex orientalis TaxID=137570 RepID=A0A343ESQ7_9CEST|nr:ATP synthase F0 subunit 6 [Breviscolex orientalis]ASL24593.1 ATP synthase F0 subunit 6 [Breviscolex orientalis]